MSILATVGALALGAAALILGVAILLFAWFGWGIYRAMGRWL